MLKLLSYKMLFALLWLKFVVVDIPKLFRQRAGSEAYGTVITLFRLISVAVTYTKTANQMGM